MIGASIFNKTNLMFFKWELSILAFLLLIALFLGRGRKHLRRAVVFLLATLPLLISGAFVHRLLYYAFKVDVSKTIKYGIAYAPTILFVMLLIYYTLWGMWRGLRKSALYLLHAVCAAAVCIGLYFFFIKSSAFDKFLLKAGDMIFGGNGALAAKLGASAECTTLREVLAEWLPSLLDYGDEIALILRDNGAYLMTLVDVAYGIVFAVVAGFFYLVLVFIMFIVYHIAYPERKYKRRKNEMFANNRTDRSYKKHTAAGGAIGFFRGFVCGILSLAVFGSVLYVAAGTGSGTLQSYSFDYNDFDFKYSIYRSIDEYGDYGIYKILNKFKDTDNSPYYLFAADLILSGNLKDENNGIKANIKLRKELGAYTSFARDTINLLLKYGEEDIKPILSGKDRSGAVNKIINVMQTPQFQAEFENLIDNFDAQTYIINFALSAINTIINNIDDTRFASSVSEKNRELLKVMFKPGYLCAAIPDDREKLEQGLTSDMSLPHIGISKFLVKSDVKSAYRMLLSYLDPDKGSTLDLVRTLLPQFSEMSILSGSRKNEFDPVFGRVYCYLANTYLSGDDGEGVRYSDIKAANVPWVEEISSLITVADEGIDLYNTVRDAEGSGVGKILSIFDEEGENYEQNVKIYDDVCDVFASSQLIGRVLSTGRMKKQVRSLFSEISENMYIPEDIVFENVYTGSGTEYGELYKVMNGLRLLGSKKNYEIMDKTLNGESMQVADMFDLIGQAAHSEDKNGNTLSYYMTDSTIMRSLISVILIENAGDSLYVPNAVLERDGEGNAVYLIDKKTLKDLFDGFTDEEIKNAVVDYINGEQDAGALLKNESVLDFLMLQNGILEGTVSKALIDELGGNDFVVLPRALEEVDAWLSVNGTGGEFYNLVKAVRDSGLDFDTFLKGNDGKEEEDKLVDTLLEMDDDAIDSMFESNVIYYTISEYVRKDEMNIGDEFGFIIPNSVVVREQNDSVEMLIRKSELKGVFKSASTLNINSESDADEIMRQLVCNKEVLDSSVIISSSVANFIVSSTISDTLKIPARYKAAGEKEALIADTNGESSLWQRELVAFVDAMDSIFEISAHPDEKFELNDETLDARLTESIPNFNKVEKPSTGETKLDVCCSSAIMLLNITAHLDTKLFGSWVPSIIEEKVLVDAKNDDGCYPRDELAALIDSITVFALKDEDGNTTGDILKIDGGSLRANAENSIVTLNDPRADLGGRTGLDAIYPSYIITSMITKELDGAFKDDVVSDDVKQALKTRRGKSEPVYTKEELAACVDALGVLGISEGEKASDKVKDIKFAELKTIAGDSEKLHVLYSSGLVAGSITKSVEDAVRGSSVLVDHTAAYENRDRYKVYRECEIQALMDLTDGESGDVSSFKLPGAQSIKNSIFGENNEVLSYIVAASLSYNIVSNENLIVPGNVIGNGIISVGELKKLLDAYSSLFGDSGIDDCDTDFKHVPENTGIAVKSDVIRATLTRSLRNANTAGGAVYVSKGNIVICDSKAITGGGKDISVDKNTSVAVISAEQMETAFDVLRKFSGGESTSFEFPEVTAENVKDLSGEELLACDMLRYKVSGFIKEQCGKLPFTENWWNENAAQEEVFDLTDGKFKPIYALTAEQIQDFVNNVLGDYSGI